MRRVLLIILLSLIFSGEAHAGIIRIAVETTAKIAGDYLQLGINVKNVGDAFAHHLKVTIPRLERTFDVAKELGPEREEKLSIELRLSEITGSSDGRHLLPIMLSYRDHHGHPFSAPQIVSFNTGEPPASSLYLRIPVEYLASPLELSDKTDLNVTVTNTGPLPIRDIKLKILTSLETSSSWDLSESIGVLMPEEEVSRTARITNQGAGIGSEYQAYAIVEARLDGKLLTSYRPFRIKIVPASPGFRLYFIISVILIALISQRLFRST